VRRVIGEQIGPNNIVLALSAVELDALGMNWSA
jgi:hypothetical protein